MTQLAPGLFKDKPAAPGGLPARASLSARAAGRKQLVVRSWRAGDRMRPLGLNGSRKIHDILVDEKVPRDQRSRVPIFECGGQIVWLPGYRVAQGWEVTDPGAANLQVRVGRI